MTHRDQSDGPKQLTIDGRSLRVCGEEAMTHAEQSDTPRTPIGRTAKLVEVLADDISRSFGGPPVAKARRDRLNRHRVERLRKSATGGSFRVSLVDDEGRPTGVIARVTVAYDSFDADEANRRRS
jgi:hypothetical protein